MTNKNKTWIPTNVDDLKHGDNIKIITTGGTVYTGYNFDYTKDKGKGKTKEIYVTQKGKFAGFFYERHRFFVEWDNSNLEWNDIDFENIKRGDIVRTKQIIVSIPPDIFIAKRWKSNGYLQLDGCEWRGDSKYEKVTKLIKDNMEVTYTVQKSSLSSKTISNFPHKCPYCNSDSYNNTFTAHVDCSVKCKESLKY